MTALRLVLLLLLVLPESVSAQDYGSIRWHGQTKNRVNIVIVAEGYTWDEYEGFYWDAADLATGLMAQEPFQTYDEYINVWYYFAPSNDSGTSGFPGEPSRDTYFGSRFLVTNPNDPNEIPRAMALSAAGTTLLNDALRDMADSQDANDSRDSFYPIVLVNTTHYGGGASGKLIVMARGDEDADLTTKPPTIPPSTVSVAEHELGHSFGDLGDEYSTPPYPAFPVAEYPNVTAFTISSGVRWYPWIPSPGSNFPGTIALTSNGVGHYQGAQYQPSGWYRAHYQDKMRSVSAPFGAVNKEQLIKRIYAHVKLIDGVYPDNTESITTPNPWGDPVSINGPQQISFGVSTPVPSPTSLKYCWKVDGRQYPGNQSGFSIPADSLTFGVHHVTVDVRDDTRSVYFNDEGTSPLQQRQDIAADKQDIRSNTMSAHHAWAIDIKYGGPTWTRVDTNFAPSEILKGNGLFVGKVHTARVNSPWLATSTNLINWTVPNGPSGNPNLFVSPFGGGGNWGFFRAGGNFLTAYGSDQTSGSVYSTDGTHWFESLASPTIFRAGASSPTHAISTVWLGTGPYSIENFVSRFTTGPSWETRVGVVPAQIEGPLFQPGHENLYVQPRAINSLAYGNGIFVGVSEPEDQFNANATPQWSTVDSAKVVRSTDQGTTWALATAPPPSALLPIVPNFGIRKWSPSKIFFGGGKFLVFQGNSAGGPNGFWVWTSADGVTWQTSFTATSTTYVSSLCYGGGKFLLIVTYPTTRSSVYWSVDGLSWNEEALSNNELGLQNFELESCAYANGRFHIFGTRLIGGSRLPFVLLKGTTSLTDFASWKDAMFDHEELDQSAISGLTASPAHDGISNAMKFALGLIPQVNATGSLNLFRVGFSQSVTTQQQQVAMEFRRPRSLADFVSYQVEATDSLSPSNWQPVSTTPEIDPPDIFPDPQLETVRITEPITPATPRRFYRLKVTLPQ